MAPTTPVSCVFEPLASATGVREVLLLIVWDEVPRDQIATMLNITIDTVNKRYQRALRRLERRLGAYVSGSDTTPSPAEEGREP